MQNIKEYTEAKKLALKESLVGANLKAVIVQVGNVEASNRYVRNKIKDLEEVGITAELYKLPEEICEGNLIKVLKALNEEDDVTGYLVQLPLPKHINEELVNLNIWVRLDLIKFVTSPNPDTFIRI